MDLQLPPVHLQAAQNPRPPPLRRFAPAATPVADHRRSLHRTAPAFAPALALAGLRRRGRDVGKRRRAEESEDVEKQEAEVPTRRMRGGGERGESWCVNVLCCMDYSHELHQLHLSALIWTSSTIPNQNRCVYYMQNNRLKAQKHFTTVASSPSLLTLAFLTPHPLSTRNPH